MPLYDEEGKPVEGALSPEEAQALKEKAEKADELEKNIQEKDELITQREEELSKLRDKDTNFAKFRQATKAEKEEMMKNWSEEQKTMMTEIERLSNEREEEKKAQMAMHEEEILGSLAGEDQDLKTKLKETAKDFVGTPKTREELFKRYKNAFTIVKGEAPKVNPINRYVPMTTPKVPDNKKKGFTDTEQGKEAYKSYFPDSPTNKK